MWVYIYMDVGIYCIYIHMHRIESGMYHIAYNTCSQIILFNFTQYNFLKCTLHFANVLFNTYTYYNIHMHIQIHIHISTYTYTYTYTYMYMHMHIQIHTHIIIYIYIYNTYTYDSVCTTYNKKTDSTFNHNTWEPI